MRILFFVLFAALCFFVPKYSFAQSDENLLPASSEVPLIEEKTIVGSVQDAAADPQATEQVQGSDSKNDPEAQTEPKTGPKYEAYKKILADGRAINAEIDRLFGEMPIGFPAKQQEYTLKIEQLKARQKALAAQVAGAAIAAYEESPQADVDLAKFVYNKMSSSINPQSEVQKFDPQMAQKLANLLTASDIQSTEILRDIYFHAFRAAFALQDFEQAELMLVKVEEHSKTALPPIVRERFGETREKWARELEVRRMEAATNDLPQVKIETAAGDFVVELFENHAPQTVANFISLVEQGFYDGLIFHLVKPGILIQAGCPVGNGTGDPGYRIPCESYRDEIRHHFTGTISMSNKGRDTGGSQFFISHQPNPALDGKYTVFGRITENVDVIFNINTVDKTKPNAGTLEPTVIKKITVLRKRDHVYEPTVVVANATPNSGAPGEPPAIDTNSGNPDKASPTPVEPGQAEPPSGGG